MMIETPPIYTAHTLEEPACVSFEQAEAIIQEGEMVDEVGLVNWGSNYTFVVTLLYEGAQYVAMYKPRAGERPLWDFPTGTLCQREAAAYVLSQMLGWYVVPPTVLREGERGIGSMQVYIEHDPNLHYLMFEPQQYREQIQRMALFDALANNADRKAGHCLVDEVGHVWGIDHGLTFHGMHKLRTVIWEYSGQAIPEGMMTDIQRLCTLLDDGSNPYVLELQALLSESELQALRYRVEKLIQMGVFALPGTGPNRPWPQV